MDAVASREASIGVRGEPEDFARSDGGRGPAVVIGEQHQDLISSTPSCCRLNMRDKK
jgi:hypothetical protein